MFLRSLALSKKLFAALLLPVALVIGFLGLRVADAVSVRNTAQAQLVEEERFEAVNAFADAVSVEGRQYFNFLSNATDVDIARAEVDARLDDLLDPELGIETPVLQRMVDLHAELLGARQVLGDGATGMRIQVQRELIEENGAGEDVGGDVTTAIGQPQAIYPQIIDAYKFDQTAISNADQAALLASYTLVQNVRSNYSNEVTALLGIAPLPAEAITPTLTEFIATSVAESNQSIETLRLVATPGTIARIESFLAGDNYAAYLPIRDEFLAVAPGEAASNVSPVEATPIGEALDLELTTLSTDIVTQLRLNATSELDNANRQLLESLVLGALTLLVMGLILVGLYLSIRNPLRTLTTRSTEIAEVELPSVVSVMRSGEGTMPDITEISSQTTDEIGELTDAFNGMYRTAIELASEQAASRRVVADMFVNLGRRNQKLLNRMLKGLGQLEQEEQDPDTLGALYKVDQLATRMRRNAESLLILAGAGQSRTFSRDVPIYEVVQSALAEVENFQRVDVDVSADLNMKGIYVADVAHLLAELVENALVFSPPSSTVEVLSRETSRGFILAVADKGVGMPQASMDAANDRIRNAAEQSETPSEFLGHYVVGRLAARHGIVVDLLEGAASGTVARIVLPPEVFTSSAADDTIDPFDQAAEVSAPDQLAPAAEPADALASFAEPASAGLELAPALHDEFVSDAPSTDEFVATTDFGDPLLGASASPFDSLDSVEAVETADEAAADHDALGAFSAGVQRADDVEQDDDAVVELDWAKVDSDLALGTNDVDVDQVVDDQTATDIDVSSGSGDEDALVLETPDAPEDLELARDFGAPAGESVPLPRVDARRPLSEPSIDFTSSADDLDFEIETPVEVEVEVEVETPVEIDAGIDADVADEADPVFEPLAEVDPVTVSPEPVIEPESVIEPEPVFEVEPVTVPTEPEFAMTASAAATDVEPDEAPTVFGFARREPGASLPTRQRRKPEAAPTTEDSPESDDTTTPDDLRSSLAGFQTGVVRAEKETH